MSRNRGCVYAANRPPTFSYANIGNTLNGRLVHVHQSLQKRASIEGIKCMFGIFKKKPANALDAFIRSVYGNPPPPKTANIKDAIDIAHGELLMDVISKEDIAVKAAELYSGPIPYSTHDLALSVALHFFKQPNLVPELSTPQLMARMKVLEWAQERKVVVPLAQSFEAILYKLYKP